MVHKKHLFTISSGQASYDFHSHRGKFDAYYIIFDADTNIPFTNAEIYSCIQARCAEEPYLHAFVDYLLPELKKKATRNPNSEFRLSCRGSCKEEALKILQSTQLQQLTDLTNILFRESQKALATAGKLTLSQFFRFARPGLLLHETEDTRKRYSGIIEKWILPVCGDVCLEQLSDEKQMVICKELTKELKKKAAKNETVRLVRKAYQLLLEDSQQYYKAFRFSPESISKQIAEYNYRNREINNAFIARHLDPDVRKRYFNYLTELDDNNFLSYINSLVYSGLDCSDISALPFSSLQMVQTKHEHFYRILVDRRQYKNGQKHATRNILNENCAFSCFRTVVLSPYATDLLDRRIAWFRSKGLSDEEIGKLSLSCEFPATASINFTELRKRLTIALNQLDIPDVSIPRSKKGKSLHLQVVNLDYQLIKDDALYVAQYICHLPLPLLHTMFDAHPTETDEISYLDLDSDELSRTHYLLTRRFSTVLPVSPCISENRNTISTGTQPHAVTLMLRFEKNANVSIHSDFATNTKWKESSSCE